MSKFQVGDMVYLKHTQLVGYIIRIEKTGLGYHVQWLNSAARTIPFSVHTKSELVKA
jgi:hypothetical protein